MTAPFKEYPYQPQFRFEPPEYPDIQFLPSGVKPTVDGYPWWVDPPGFLNPPPAPELPPFQLGPTDFAERSEGRPTNWLLSYYDQNRSNLESPLNIAPAIASADSAGPRADSRGLLGALYAMAQRASPQPDHGFVSDMQDTPEQELPERRLGRRTYRA